ncbi:MAG TPA: hypothetical protein VJ772_07190 [Nitrososphaeraceae archaeon]|nr:hypothetical protein [Nitrososphaeraceae archaeon]
MTINNTWLRNEVVRFYISGEPQDKIANKLKISTGKVSSLVNEIIKSDDTIDLQRQIAIIAKKNKTSIKQIAANLRYKNLIKLNLLDETKSEKFLNHWINCATSTACRHQMRQNNSFP